MNTVTPYCSQQWRPGQSGFWSQRLSRRAYIGALIIVWIEPSVSSPPHGRWVPPPPWYPAECCATLREAPSSRRAAKLPLQLSVCATCSYKQWTSSLVFVLYEQPSPFQLMHITLIVLYCQFMFIFSLMHTNSTYICIKWKSESSQIKAEFIA